MENLLLPPAVIKGTYLETYFKGSWFSQVSFRKIVFMPFITYFGYCVLLEHGPLISNCHSQSTRWTIYIFNCPSAISCHIFLGSSPSTMIVHQLQISLTTWTVSLILNLHVLMPTSPFPLLSRRWSHFTRCIFFLSLFPSQRKFLLRGFDFLIHIYWKGKHCHQIGRL